MTTSPQDALTATVLERVGDAADERFKELMTKLVKHLHAFLRDADVTPEEWMKGLEFLTATGQITDEKRQEFILLSDTLGVSMMVVMLQEARAQRNAEDRIATKATEATVQGPFYWEGAPDTPLGADIAEGVKGVPTFYAGRVTDTAGKPLPGALLDIWSGDGEGVYDMQVEGRGMAARARLRTDAEGRYWFWSICPSYYPIPMDGPVGRMLERMRRHPNRPGHIHMKVSAPGHVDLTTHLFVRGGPFLDSDPVFGVREDLVIDFAHHEPGTAPDGRVMAEPYRSASFDFKLAPAA